ncbi:hypothetical protein SAMD00019534_062180 [Acytostelium subglobosum LB1]|uniref:hypothetical protein n=1 Tax=Acytostelium subglobosum LB1 TaxID=1410327 RepID=UPI000644DEB0|nr:hypothetical protein SAMD00019534_062180 [Acytostelium subglobosum LB1]GAM23043.1 hypothetical protein SAMD00019534_062180 [Acytostelium subglobosum LB1]|eukprot:XP_012754270.1 hypothetical protein SAMD00019534_062180 [Acytostelium subglobosum LB1]
MSDQEKQKTLSETSITENENINLYPINTTEPKTFWEKYSPARIPCFKDSLIYGIGSGVGVTFFTSIFTSKPPMRAADFGVLTFLLVSGSYWPICNYNKQVQERRVRMVMDAQIAEMNRKTQESLQEKQQSSSSNNNNDNSN